MSKRPFVFVLCAVFFTIAGMLLGEFLFRSPAYAETPVEYKVVFVPTDAAQGTKILNDYGKDGWQVAGVMMDSRGLVILKK